MATCEANVISGSFIPDISDSAATAKSRDVDCRVASPSLAEILRETATAIDRRVVWVMEIMTLLALGVCLILLSFSHQEPARWALGIATAYFGFSSSIGAGLL